MLPRPMNINKQTIFVNPIVNNLNANNISRNNNIVNNINNNRKNIQISFSYESKPS